MSRGPGAILRHLEQLYNHGTATGLSEPDLLNRFLTHRDESAFATLVARYGPMILGVCRRNLREERDVEDAFQATFLIFVRRAHAISDPARLGPWLHGVAHRVAVRAKAQAAQRHRLEPTSAIPSESAAIARIENNDHHELTQVLDTELARLPKSLRDPIILCYLEGLTHDQAAQRLRWPVGTVRSRMARARSLLKTRLARRGITPYTSAIATALTRQPVSISLIERTIQFSLALGSPKTLTLALTTIPAAALAKGVLQTMFVTKTATVAALTLSGILAFGGAGSLARHLADEGAQNATTAVALPVTESQKPQPTAQTNPASEEDGLIKSLELMEERLSALKTEGPKRIRREEEKLKALTEGYEQKIKELKAFIKSVRPESVLPIAPAESARQEAKSSPPQNDVIARDAATNIDPTVPKQNDQSPAPIKSTISVTLRVPKAVPGAERPDMTAIGNQIVMIEPPGDKLTIYDTRTGVSVSRRLPPVNGVRRIGTTFQYPWIFTKDLDRRRPDANDPVAQAKAPRPKVTRISAYNLKDSTWLPHDLPEPIEDRSISEPTALVFRTRKFISAFSPTKKRWCILDTTDSANPASASKLGDACTVELDGRVYIFNEKAGEWADMLSLASPEPPRSTNTTRPPQ
jgi:RNA polymerase sigma factor (sigma-70 family)